MSASRRRLVLPAALACAAAVVAIVAWRWLRPAEPPLPSTIVSEAIVLELSNDLDPAAVVTQATGDPPRVAELRPGDPLLGQGARPGLITPVPSRLRFHVDVPPDGVLTFGVGVQGDGERDPARSGVRFAVAVDGHERWTRTINPAAAKKDRRWFDERVDLRHVAGQAVDLELIADAESPGQPLSGIAGWGTVRLVRESHHPRQRAAADRPNVLVLLVDTLRADGLGTYGASPSPSPNLDRFATEGLVFEQTIAQAPWTLPSVATIFTGLHPRSHGAIGETGDIPTGAAWGFLADGVDTIADRAIRAGITTFGVSTNPIVSRGTNLAQGFERFVELPWSQEHRNWAPAAAVNREFLDWLAQNHDWRFFAYLHYMEPHDPYTPPPSSRPAPPPGTRADLAAGWVLDVSKRIAKRGDLVLPPDQVAYLRALYDGEIRAWDAELPAVLDTLERFGVRDSTVVIITADHGEEFMEHGLLRHRKHLYEESIRVPLLMVGPGVPRGRRGEQAQGIDLHPTLASLLGLEAAGGLPGHSLLETLPPRTAISETMGGLTRDGQRADLTAARTPEWKVIDASEPADDECFDLTRDPAEQAPLPPDSGHGPRLRVALDDFTRSAAPAPVHAGYDPELRDKLQALGYAD